MHIEIGRSPSAASLTLKIHRSQSYKSKHHHQVHAVKLDQQLSFMKKNRNEREQMKKEILHKMYQMKAPPNASPDEEIECLVKQAEFYTNFLLSKFESREKQNGQDGQYVPFTRLTEQPSVLEGGQLKYYQLIGLNWLISLYESGISGILADDMGLGKTIQTISILAFLKEYKDIPGPHLIIAPKVTLGNWKKQLEKWLPCLRTLKLQATKEERQIGLQTISKGDFDVVVTSYEGVRIAETKLKKIKWQYLVIDQAHKIKNESSQISQKVRALQNECKLLLTGTPLQNNLHQLWSLMNFLIPEVFRSAEPFDNWTNGGSNGQTESKAQSEKKNIKMIQQLHKILKPFMLRRTKAEVQKSLPGKKEIHIYVGLSQIQLKIYRNLLQNRNASEDQKRYYLNLLMQLRKVCSHPYLFPNIQPQDAPPIGEHLVTASGKLSILDQLLAKLYKQGDHKVLIFSQMTTVLDILQDYCNLRLYRYCRIDGNTDIKSRQSQIDAFQGTDEHFIFLLSTRAGGLGINLTAADTVVIYDSDFNPQMDLQAMDRAHRIGQKKFVKVYRLITENTVEEKIVERQMIKLKWDSLVIQQQKAAQKNKALTKDEMKEMLQHGASEIFKATSFTLSDKHIEDLLNRGEAKTQEFNHQLQKQMKPQSDLLNLNMDSINIFDFMQKDQEKKRKDAQMLEEMAMKEMHVSLEARGRRQKVKPTRIKIDKKVILPEYHFYPNKQRLLELMQKEEDYKNNKGLQECPPLTLQEQKQKQKLIEGGFKHWNKLQFNSFVSANQKWGRHNLKEIAQMLGRPLEDVKAYSQAFWSRLDQISQSEKILKFIQAGESKQQNRKQQYQLLIWKKNRCNTMEFNPTHYNKFKSKLYSIDADVFLSEKVLAYGTRSIVKVKEEIRQQSIFRFDHYLRTRNQSDLNKRLASIYKLLEKERDNDMYGLDRNTDNTNKRKRIRPWQKAAIKIEEGKTKKKKHN